MCNAYVQMSNTRLQKFLDRPECIPSRDQIVTPALLSDSKGLRLKDTNEGSRYNLKFWCKKGATLEEETYWLHWNLRRKVRKHKKIHLFVWLITCDLTYKKGKYIDLLCSDIRMVEAVEMKLRDLLAEVAKYPDVDVTLLEAPIYSIEKYNNKKGHPNSEIFKEKDVQLLQQIEGVNERSRAINVEIGRSATVSPRFSVDLQARRKVNKKYQSYYNYGLLEDGLHPDILLARAWLKRIGVRICSLCY